MATAAAPETHSGRSAPPSWLDAAFVARALEKAGKHAPIHVENIEIQYAVPVGDNFCSRIFRVAASVRGEDGPRSLLVKCPPEGERFAKLIEEQGFFQREVSMFTEILPELYARIRGSGRSGNFQLLAARCLSSGTTPERFLVLQDLREDQFYVGDRRKGLTMEQATLALKTLGSFHATTHVLLKEKPELFKTMTNPLENDCFGPEDRFNETLTTISRAVGEWSELYAKKLLTLKGRVYDELPLINRPRPGKFNVLTHGDFWVNNMMFRNNDEGEIVDIRFLDFQMCHEGNPALDLILFRTTSLREDVFLNKWDELLNVYVQSLSDTLQMLGQKPVTLKEIKECMEEARYFSVAATLMWLPLVRMVKGKHDVEKVLKEGSSTQSDTYRTPEFTQWMKIFMSEFDEQGIFGPI